QHHLCAADVEIGDDVDEADHGDGMGRDAALETAPALRGRSAGTIHSGAATSNRNRNSVPKFVTTYASARHVVAARTRAKNSEGSFHGRLARGVRIDRMQASTLKSMIRVSRSVTIKRPRPPANVTIDNARRMETGTMM